MGNGDKKIGQIAHYVGIAIMAVIFSLPAISSGKISWLNGFVPLPVFYYLTSLGEKEGFAIIRTAILLAGGMAIFLGSAPLLILSLTLAPVGIIFFQAVEQQKSPLTAALRGIFFLIIIWVIFWTAYGLLNHINPYNALLQALDQGLAQTYLFYEKSAELSVEAKQNIESAFQQLRLLVPRILPALLLSGILTVVWMNLTLGNWLLKKKSAALTPWRGFNEWRLPETMVWGIVIGIAALLFLPAPLSTIALNVVIVGGILYFFQGLAVLVNLLLKWSAPTPVRVVVYGLIIIQAYGIILLSLVGIADIWANFRKLEPQKQHKRSQG